MGEDEPGPRRVRNSVEGRDGTMTGKRRDRSEDVAARSPSVGGGHRWRNGLKPR